jgi:hypothetical protein
MVGLVILIAIRVSTMGLAHFPISRVDPSCLIAPASIPNEIGATDRTRLRD